jgi:hypothetical protein
VSDVVAARECTSNSDVEAAGWELLVLKYLQGDPLLAGTALRLPADLAPLAAALVTAPEEVSRMASIVGHQCRDHVSGSPISDDTFWYLCKKGGGPRGWCAPGCLGPCLAGPA